MTNAIGSRNQKSRHRRTIPKKMKGKLSISQLLQELKIGERVVLKERPSVHKGVYFRRFHGRTGKVIGSAGSCYKIEVKDGRKNKVFFVNPAHLIKVKSQNGTKSN